MPISIRIAGNTILPTLLAIQHKGYKINLKYKKIGENLRGVKGVNKLEAIYIAEKDNYIFSAKDPETLLGLIAMWELGGDNWNYDFDKDKNIYKDLTDSLVICSLEDSVIEEE